MIPPPPKALSRGLRFAAWLDRRRRAVLALSIVALAGSGALAARLPVRGDFAHLLPPDATSVRHLRALEGRARVFGTIMIGLDGADAAARARASATLRRGLDGLGPDEVASVTWDDGEARRFAWDNRFLFAPLDELVRAHDALDEKLRRARLGSNPLYVDFEDDEAAAGAAEVEARVASLRHQLAEAERAKDTPSPLRSKDGRLELVILRTPFPASDVSRGRAVLARIDAAIAGARRDAGPGVELGVTGDVLTTSLEHRSLLEGMVLSTILTVLVCAGALLLYYRSIAGIAALLWSLGVGAVATFAFTRLAIGHLNLATAFLSSIIIGNGINFGIMLLARHLEEGRAGRRGVEALGAAISGTATGTFAAAMTAAVAYGSLVVTDFRGFRHFGVMGFVGILLCWVAAYTVLPAAILILERRGWLGVQREPRLGAILARAVPDRPRAVLAASGAVIALAAVIAGAFITGSPYEKDLRNLRSSTPAIAETRRWMARIDEGFGRGISGGFVIGLPDAARARAVAARLRAVDDGKSAAGRTFSRVSTIDDALPPDQGAKLRVLAAIRDLLDEKALAELSEEDRRDALRLRPPAGLRRLEAEDVPPLLAWPYTERDGTRGRIVLANIGPGYDQWDTDDLIRFSDDVRALGLGEDALLGGPTFVFADVIRSMKRDGPMASLVALVGSVLVVAFVLGVRRHGVVTIVSGLAGTLIMVAAAAALGLKVNFLDFVALPLTIGIGIDYAANLAARARQEGTGTLRRVIATTGGAVFLCSFTTVVGYASLLLSTNQGIRSFGVAAMLGEVACMIAAFVLAPSLLATLEGRPAAAPAGEGERAA